MNCNPTGTGEPGGLPSMGSHRVGHDWSDLAAAAAAGSSIYGDSLGNTQVGGHALFQGIFLTQELNLGLPHCRWILNHLSHQGSPITISTVNFCVFSVFVVMVCIILMKKECDLFRNSDLSCCTLWVWAPSAVQLKEFFQELVSLQDTCCRGTGVSWSL